MKTSRGRKMRRGRKSTGGTRSGIFGAFIAALVILPTTSSIGEELAINWAGLSFLGEHSDTGILYPHSFAISKETTEESRSRSALDARLQEIVERADPPNYAFRSSDSTLASVKGGDSLSMALVIDREDIAIEKIRNDYKLVIDLSAQILVFDYEESKILAAFPVAAQLIDVVEDSEPSSERIRGLVRGMYFGGSATSVNILKDFEETLNRQKVNRKYKQRIMVLPVALAPEVVEYFPPESAKRPKILSRAFGQLFARHLSVNQLVSVLPSSQGKAIGGKMALQFTTGNALNLELPDASYYLKVQLTEFKRVLFDEAPSASSWVYGAYINVTADCGLKPCLDSVTFKQGLTKIIPATQAASADWPVYWEVVNELADGLTMQMQKKPDKKWLKKHTKDKGARKGLQALAKKLEECR